MNTNFKIEHVVYVVTGILAAILLLFIAIPLLSTNKTFDTSQKASFGAFVVHADDGGAEGGAGGGGGSGDGGSGGSDGSGTDGGATGGAGGGGGCCGGDAGTGVDGGAPSGGIDVGGSESVAYVAPVQMSGSISSSVGICVPSGNSWKRRVTVQWSTQNTHYTVVQSAGGQYGNGQNITSESSNPSGSITLDVSAGAYIFAIAGYRAGAEWTTLNTVTQFVNTDDCAPKPVVHWTPYCTMGNDPNGNNWQWWEYSDTNPTQYRYLRAGDGVCVPPQQPMSGSISATVGACVPGVAKRYVAVSWSTQHAQQSVAQAAGGTYGGGKNLISPTTNASGTLTLELASGGYVFGVAGYNGSWVTLQNIDRLVSADDCVSTTVVNWTPYCTMGNDPNGNHWQWWEKSDTNPVQYRYLRAGDGVCVPPQQPNPVCPAGTSGTYPNCIVINNNNTNTNNNTNNNNNVITINNPAPQTQVIYRDRDSRSRSNYNDYRYNDYGACTITVSPSVVAYGQPTTLAWSSNSASSGWIEGVGNVAAYGSMQTTPTRSGVYTGRFVGYNGQTITCSAYITVSGAYVPPTYNTPYVSLASVPYTGLELGPYGTVIYWSFLILWCLFAAYLVAVKKVQNNIANWFTGKRSEVAEHAHEVHAAHGHEVHATHDEMPTYTYREDTVDPFIAQQLKLVQK